MIDKIKYYCDYEDLILFKGSNGSVGIDIKSKYDYKLKKGERELISTGLFFCLPNDMEIQIRPRSGLAYKNGITVLNSPGTIDSDYRGEIKILLINHGHDDFEIKKGMRIAQLVFNKIYNNFNLELINETDFKNICEKEKDNTRGSSGFGSTGIL